MTPDSNISGTEEAQAGNVALLPCPFCGGKPERRGNPLSGRPTMAHCIQCGASAFDKKWNRRSAPALPQDEDLIVLLYKLEVYKLDRLAGLPAPIQSDDKLDAVLDEAAAALRAQSSTIASAREVIEPFARAAEKYGVPYLAKREQERTANPSLNLPHNYAQAVDAAAEQTSWNHWDAARDWKER